MTDNVLQSFCERCGTRFTQPAPPAERPAASSSVLGRFRRRGPEASTAPGDDAALPLSEAFRDTFRFCLECRRYNCSDCWNEREGHCLSCRPLGASAASPEQAGTVASPWGPTTPEGSTAPWATQGAGAPAALSEVGKPPTAWPTDDLERAASASRPIPGAEGPADATSGSDAAPSSPAWSVPASGAGSPASDAVPATAGEALDPWRGVVFTAEDRGRVERVNEPFVPIIPVAQQPSPAAPLSSPPTWPAPGVPGGDQPGVASAAPPGAVPGEEVGVLASLIDSDAHVDAASWARASSAVVGMGSLRATADADAGTPVAPGEAGDEHETGADEEGEAAGLASSMTEADLAARLAGDMGASRTEAFDVGVPADTGPSTGSPWAEAGSTVPSWSEVVAEPELVAEPEVVTEPEIVSQPEIVTEPDVVAQPEVVAEPEGLPSASDWQPSLDDGPISVDELGSIGGLAAAGAVADGAPAPAEAPPAAVETASLPGPAPALPADQLDEPAIASQPPPSIVSQPSPPAAPLPPPPGVSPGPLQPIPTPAPGLEVWAPREERGPFTEPYQVTPAQQGTVYIPDRPVSQPPAAAVPAAAAMIPAASEVVPPAPPVPPVAPMPGLSFSRDATLSAQAAAPPAASMAPPASPPTPPPSAQPHQPPPPYQPTQPPPAGAWAQPPVPRQTAASRACPSCGLPLSTKARFCRRCGAPQPP